MPEPIRVRISTPTAREEKPHIDVKLGVPPSLRAGIKSAAAGASSNNGIPKGGETGDILVKASDRNYDAEWTAPDYESLGSKPSINGVELTGDLSLEALGIDQTYTYAQTSASDCWVIEHGLGKYPSVTIVDSGGSVVVGDVQYLTENTIVITFPGIFSGTAYLN